MKQELTSRFYIVNRFDCPNEQHMSEKRADGLFYYIHPSLRHDKAYWGMNPSNPTPVEDFGISLTIENGVIRGVLKYPSIATYLDDRPRKWQGADAFGIDYQPRAKK